jgi:hypothetical protein
MFNLQMQPSHCNSSSTQAPSKNNKISHLKGSRKLQLPLGFSGGIAQGTSISGGGATGSGSASVEALDDEGIADGSGGGEFTSTSGSSGFIDTVFGSAQGSSAAGATGEQAGNVGIRIGGMGSLSFDGTTESSGMGSFGAGLSPVQFNTVVTEIPGTAIEGTSGSPKKGGTTGGVSPPTFITTIVPVATGPTGGFGAGSGSFEIDSTTSGMLIGDSDYGIGVGSSGGEATNFGGGSGSATNFLGSAGGLGSGASTGYAEASGGTKYDTENGIFTGTGGATGGFSNQGAGFFGKSQSLAFP